MISVFGCMDLTPGKQFSFVLGDTLNRLHFALRDPVTTETTHGFFG